MVSLPLLLLLLLQLMDLWFNAFWDPHPVLDTHPRRLSQLTYFDVYKTHRAVLGAVNVFPNSP